jgi:hypothetical protein
MLIAGISGAVPVKLTFPLTAPAQAGTPPKIKKRTVKKLTTLFMISSTLILAVINSIFAK